MQRHTYNGADLKKLSYILHFFHYSFSLIKNHLLSNCLKSLVLKVPQKLKQKLSSSDCLQFKWQISDLKLWIKKKDVSNKYYKNNIRPLEVLKRK